MQSEYINISKLSMILIFRNVYFCYLALARKQRGDFHLLESWFICLRLTHQSPAASAQRHRGPTCFTELDWSCIAPEAEISRLPPTSRDDGFCFRLAVTQPSDSDTNFPPLTLPTRLLWVLPCIPSAVVCLCLCSLTPMLHHLLFHRAWFSFHVKTSLAGGCRCGVIGSGDQFT